MKLYTTVLLTFIVRLINAQSTSDHIHIDQFGYLPSAVKVAVISNPQVGYNANESYTPGNTLQVIDASNQSIIYSGSPSVWGNGQTHDQSGDKGWWFDFSSVSDIGDYYILDVDNNLRSYTFAINDDVYIEVLKSAVKMFYYNRCNMDKEAPYAEDNWVDGDNFGNALQDTECRFIFDRYNENLEKDLSGGWFDAGDYNKYVTYTQSTLHNLLRAYEENMELFTDDWNIPESGNGIPDLIDEINWEISWLQKMVTEDGSVINKVGSQNYGENISSPPSLNVDQRFYGHTCSSSTIAVASIFAHASDVYEHIPGLETLAEELKNTAITCFNQVTPQLNSGLLDLDCDDGSIVSGDADVTWEEQYEDALLAALHLYEITDSSVYANYISANIYDARPIRDDWISPETTFILEALFHYAERADANPATVDSIFTSVMPHIEGDWNDFFGMNDLDLYRATMPDWAYFWGSNRVKAEFGNMNNIFVKYGINAGESESYALKASQQLHYYHGVNPQNMVQLSNMYSRGGEKCVNQIYHTWFNDGTDYDHAQTSLYGPAPGFLTGGANGNYTYSGYNPPYGQPKQKCYLDFNDNNGSSVPWEITEPAIYYQAAYIRLLANYVSNTCNGRNKLYVDLSNNSNEDGLTWESAYTSFQSAINDECILSVDSILVAEGEYIPDTDKRNFKYEFPKDIVIQGGYNPGGMIYNPALYTSSISGNIGNYGSALDNLFHAFSANDTSISITLDGLTIKDGRADGTDIDAQGGGILSTENMTLKNVTLSNNSSIESSAGIYNPGGTLTILNGCTLINNSQL